MKHANSLAAILVVVHAVRITAVAQAPTPRHLEQIAFDLKRNKLVVFGGAEIGKTSFSEPSDFYEWDGQTWKKINGTIPGRRAPSLVYDPTRKATISIGGIVDPLHDNISHEVFSWDGKTWRLINKSVPVKEPEAVYADILQTILVYGRVADQQSNPGILRPFELWELRKHKWQKLSSDGPSPQSPVAMSFDVKRQTLVIPTWTDSAAAVWEWQGKVWNKIGCALTCPPARTRFGFAFDPLTGESILFGGLDSNRKLLADTWKWNGIRWEEIRASVPARASHNLLATPQGLILYGGLTANGLTSELWEFKNNAWQKR